MALFDTVVSKNCSEFDELAESAAQVALYNFGWQYASLILFNSTLVCGVDVFIKLYNKSVIIGKSTFNTWFVENTTQFVLFLDSVRDLASLLEWLKTQRFNNTGNYVIICYSTEEDQCDELTAVSLLWQNQVANIIFIKNDNLQNPCGYTFFQDESCKNSLPEKLSKWDTCFKKSDESHCREMFPLKFKNLHKCPLIVSTFEQEPFMKITDGCPSGADGDLLNVILKSLNATLILMTPRLGKGWGKLEDNGTWSGSLADIYYDWANFSMTSPCVTLRRFRYFQMSTNYNVVSLVWVTHPSKLEPQALKLLRPYNTEARIGLLGILIAIFIAAMFLKTKYWRSIQEKLNISEIPYSIVFHSWEICMGLPATRLPTKCILLYCTLLWIWYCYLLRTLYQVYLINCLQTDFLLDDILTIEDAIDDAYPFGGGLALKDYFIDDPYIYKHWQNIESNEIYPVMTKLSEGMKFVLAMNFATAKAFLKRPKRKLHILPQKIITSPTAIFFKKYSWLAPAINTILTNLIESGLTQKIYKDNTFIHRDNESGPATPLNLEDFTGCFLILLIGWSLSFLTLMIEKYIHSRKKTTRLIIANKKKIKCTERLRINVVQRKQNQV